MARKPRADKGKTRGPYKLNEFRQARDALREITRQRREAGRPRHERREEHRRMLLPSDRKCPLCERIKIDSRQWVLLHGTTCVCLSCFRRHGREGCVMLLPRLDE